MRRTGRLKRRPFRRGPKQGRITKSGRVILSRAQYAVLCHEVWLRDKGLCQINHNEFLHSCWHSLPYFSTRWVDHIVKRSQGGGDILSNLRLACPPCHDWADQRGGKLIERQEKETRSIQ